MTNPNDPAFLRTHGSEHKGEYSLSLTKREYFAAMAMQGIISGRYGSGEIDLFRIDLKDLSFESVATADALIAELSKETK